VICTPDGAALDAPLAVEPDCAWVGYGNPAIRDAVQPALQAALRRRDLLMGHEEHEARRDTKGARRASPG